MDYDLHIGGIGFNRIKGVRYSTRYWELVGDVTGTEEEVPAYRDLFLKDLWALCYFGLGFHWFNHPFLVGVCREVEVGPEGGTLDLWARGHCKSSILTVGETVQYGLRNPHHVQGIFSYARSPARSFLRQIKYLLETREVLKACFPDVLWGDPVREAWKWSEDEGLYFRRGGGGGFAKEANVEAHGMIEGMPTGKHFNRIIFDDIMTDDVADSPEVMWKVREKFDQAMNLGMHGVGWVHRVVGTPYHHEDVLQMLRQRVDPVSGGKVYEVRVKAATVGGEWNGKPVYMGEDEIARLRMNPRKYSAQQLLDPRPSEVVKLDSKLLRSVSRGELPKRLFRVMVVDPAGMRRADKRVGDAWGLAVLGFEPFRDDLGASNVYLLDLEIKVFSNEVDAMRAVVGMYCRNGRIMRLGVEKVGISTFEVHIANALRSRGRIVTIESGTLVALSPAGRPKEKRIEQNLAWALNNGKVFAVEDLEVESFSRFKMEMEKFPFWHDDGIDCVSYGWDLLKDMKFGVRGLNDTSADVESRWDRVFNKNSMRVGGRPWMAM